MDPYYISKTVDITYIRDHPYLPWDRSGLSLRDHDYGNTYELDLPNATGEWNYTFIGSIVPMEYVKAHPDKVWDKKELSNREDIDINVVLMDMPNAIGKWDWSSLSQYIPMDQILEHKDLESWDWSIISEVVDDVDIVYNNPDKAWNKDILSWNDCITYTDMVTLVLPNAIDDWCMKAFDEDDDSYTNSDYSE